MAERPIYIPVTDEGPYVKTYFIEFKWFPGMAITQAQKSVDALHFEARNILQINKILEISSKSKDELGINLSAFNLMIRTVKKGRAFSVECAYQSSKVFEKGGPYNDLLDKSSREAKKDHRLKSSGRLIRFEFYNVRWDLEPQTAFYDWLYLNALNKQPLLAERVLEYSAFTDISFNPEKSINCQAYSAALYVALHKRGILKYALSSKDEFIEIIKEYKISNAYNDEICQPKLRF